MKNKSVVKFQNPMVISILLHIVVGIIITPFIETKYSPEEEFVKVDWVLPPPVKMKPHRSMPKGLPKVKISKQKMPSKPSSKTVKRSAHKITEVIEESPEIVRESVKIDHDAKISDILPVVTTIAKFDTQTQTHEATSVPRATPKMVEAPATGRKSDRVREAGKDNYQGLAGADIFGAERHFGDGIDSGIGDGFADVGTEAPKYIDIGKLEGENPNDIFGIGKYVDKGRGERKDQDVVYVLDISRSMKSGDKIEFAKQALKDAIAMLRENDKFNIIVFNNRVEVYSKKLLPVTQNTLKKAYRYLNGIELHRGTNLSEALEKSLKLNASTIVVISDGDPTRGITDTTELLNMVQILNRSKARVMPIGIGRGHSSEGIELLTKLARQNNGEIRLIDISDSR